MDSAFRDKVRQIEPDFFVAAQLAPSDLPEARLAGFRTIINNRPDLEGGSDQPTSADLQAKAAECGLAYHHLPVAPAEQNEDEARAMAHIVASSPRPILAFCRTGRRSAALYAKGKNLP